MRVIAGTHRRRELLGPQGDQVTRPITNRVKQSVFDRLWSMGVFDDESAAALDLFSGTGSLGIEALSRGVAHCTFVERDRSARQLLEKNLDTLGLSDRATVLGVDVLSLGLLGLSRDEPVGLVFCDPPYKMTGDAESLKRLAEALEALRKTVSDGAVLVLRTDGHVQGPALAGWHGPDTHGYGSMAVHFYEAGLDA